MVNRPRLSGSALRTAVAVIAAAGALTACGQVNVGTAATVGDDRITTVRLDETVRTWHREFAGDSQAERFQQAQQNGAENVRTVPYDLGSPRRSALYQMIDNLVWQQVARDAGITVSQGETDAFAAANGGRPAVVSIVRAHDLPAREADAMLRSALIKGKVLKQLGYDPDRQPAQPDQATVAKAQKASEQLTARYIKAAGELKIKVNPRFGTFDPATVSIAPVSFALSKNEPGIEDTGAGDPGTGDSGTGDPGTGGTDPGGAGADLEGTGAKGTA